MMVIENKYSIGEAVYLLTDPDQRMMLITGIIVRPSGVLYYLSYKAEETLHYEFELTSDINELIKLK